MEGGQKEEKAERLDRRQEDQRQRCKKIVASLPVDAVFLWYLFTVLQFLLTHLTRFATIPILLAKSPGDTAITRKLRKWYPGALYHVMHRGIRRKEIFSHDADFQTFLAFLQAELERYSCTLHAYCLMTNHFHLLIETSHDEIWKLMKNLSHNYAQYYNSQHSYKGHLFEGRYVSCLVEDDTYFIQTSRYIHLNPVKARMTAHPEDYRWSSYKAMVGMGDDGLTKREKTLSYFKDGDVRRYRDFVEDAGHKYAVTEDQIRKAMGENDLWLPWDNIS